MNHQHMKARAGFKLCLSVRELLALNSLPPSTPVLKDVGLILDLQQKTLVSFFFPEYS
jgi:hypothetical protein